MSEQPTSTPHGPQRRVRAIDIDARNLAEVTHGIDDLYGESLDVIVVRGAFDAAALADAGQRLDSDERDAEWSRPNERMPLEDLQLLGTDTPATPTYREPRGASLDAYLSSAITHASATAGIFKPGFDAAAEIHMLLGRLSGGRPVEVAQASDGRSYVPFTIRRLTDGKQIGIHHDNHYGLALYQELAQKVDTRTLISYVATLRAPQAGGEMFVYGATSDATDVPKLANGFSYDLSAIEKRYDCQRFVMNAGDLFLLASGRCLHRVGRISGFRARITMGGFLALGKAGEQVFYWS